MYSSTPLYMFAHWHNYSLLLPISQVELYRNSQPASQSASVLWCFHCVNTEISVRKKYMWPHSDSTAFLFTVLNVGRMSCIQSQRLTKSPGLPFMTYYCTSVQVCLFAQRNWNRLLALTLLFWMNQCSWNYVQGYRGEIMFLCNWTPIIITFM